MSIKCITHAEYDAATKKLGGSHWKNCNSRWKYHEAASKFAELARPPSANSVIEIGTMGISIVPGSDTMDYDADWSFSGFNPTYFHDARVIPWPVPSKKYELLIALRVFQHLAPRQEECFHEAKRVARNIIIVAPETYSVPELPNSAGITESMFRKWNGGLSPTAIMNFEDWIGKLYFWKDQP
jgi:hypothetical protein